MPGGRIDNSPSDSAQLSDENVTLQTKRCSACQGPLNADSTGGSLYPPESSETTSWCSACREARLTQRTPLMVCPTASAVVHDGARDIDVPIRLLLNSKNNVPPMHDDRQHDSESSISDEDVELHDEEGGVFSADEAVHVGPSVLQSSLPIPVPISTPSLQSQHTYQRNPSPEFFSPPFGLVHSTSPLRRTFSSASDTTRSPHVHDSDHDHSDGYPDPFVDISRLRVRSRGYRCLQPGATFKGVQKSGRNSYDVNVTIVDVDFASSFLCGYLRICGLTDDWPELTTYFDAEIIGMRHGFDTQDWGATRQEDDVHWGRFPRFHDMQNSVIEPRRLLPANTSRPAIFMRWKERFLIPDHRVQDISGASFAGFYYVCVDFDPQPEPSTPPATVQDVPMCIESTYDPTPAVEPSRFLRNSLRHASRRRTAAAPVVWEDAELGTGGEMPKARMSGFYYHKNSEPYQQLSLTHVESSFRSSFEFR